MHSLGHPSIIYATAQINKDFCVHPLFACIYRCMHICPLVNSSWLVPSVVMQSIKKSIKINMLSDLYIQVIQPDKDKHTS